MQEIYDKARNVRVAIFDVDGVLTEGTLYYLPSGEELKAFNVLDGHGMKMLQESGVKLAVISSRSSSCVEERARNLGIELLYQGAGDKLAAFDALLVQCGVAADSCSFIGDDAADVPVMRRCGLAASVPNAPALVRWAAHYVTRARGGHGAARELCELIIHAQGVHSPVSGRA
ncbi:MAG TPA: HAD hydrolase family protein [Burkholderiales bacterium]|jgi:3-deoxy-D-manno-octulosonate 8-phosphate phosphatase (KDO 8-P phosphatase)|nr:HAD hydrolase family protein [Burkholderiales bacterium]